LSSLSYVGLFALISAILQLMYPEFILKLKPLGVRSEEAVKLGGYIGLFVSPFIILFDIFIVK